jgi:hypothetical protein
MRTLLYSKWFFAFLALVCVLDLFADLAERLWEWTALNDIAILLDVIMAVLSVWMFADLHQKRPGRGDHSRG